MCRRRGCGRVCASACRVGACPLAGKWVSFARLSFAARRMPNRLCGAATPACTHTHACLFPCRPSASSSATAEPRLAHSPQPARAASPSNGRGRNHSVPPPPVNASVELLTPPHGALEMMGLMSGETTSTSVERVRVAHPGSLVSSVATVERDAAKKICTVTLKTSLRWASRMCALVLPQMVCVCVCAGGTRPGEGALAKLAAAARNVGPRLCSNCSQSPQDRPGSRHHAAPCNCRVPNQTFSSPHTFDALLPLVSGPTALPTPCVRPSSG